MENQVKLGDLLLAQKIITEAQLQQALEHQKGSGERLGQVLISLGFITEQQFFDFFSQQLNIPFYDLRIYQLDPKVANTLPESFARLYRATVLKEQPDGSLLVGMADPLNLTALDHIKQLLNKPLSRALVKDSDLAKAMDLVYRHTKEISGYAKALSQEIRREDKEVTVSDTVDAPVIHLLNTLFADAAQMNASDIHIEPNEEGIRIRLRVDGILQEQWLKEVQIMPAIVSRLKLMSGLNIAERRLPQDGRFEVPVNSDKYDVRLSTMPTSFGESVVLRLLKQAGEVSDLEKTGMHGIILQKFREQIKKPNGIILVTGPTGSGKSTTLYAAMHELNRPEIKIITIEDPIEYFLPWAVQIQTNEKIGLSFAAILRSTLRHDPDVILLGEMRDGETSTIAMRTALTGRLVLSTLHTNDAINSVYRLIDLGVEPYIIAATVQAIVAQRLLRMICESCSQDYMLTPQEMAWLAKLNLPLTGLTFKHGAGCSHCSHTGYKGRMAIFELLEFTEPIANALRKNEQTEFHKFAQAHIKGKQLVDDAFRLVAAGKTTVQEMIRVINEGV